MPANDENELIRKIEKMINSAQAEGVTGKQDIYIFDEYELAHIKEIIEQHRERPDHWHETTMDIVEKHHRYRRMGKDFYGWIIGASLLIIATTNIGTNIGAAIMKLIGWLI